MPEPEPELPPRYFGDYPGGFYMSAEIPADASDDGDENYTIVGDDIRFSWDYGVVVPLWNEGLLPEEPEWLRRALGLSDELIQDLTAWGEAMCALDGDRRVTEQDYRGLDQRARFLVERLASELDPRYRISYVPRLTLVSLEATAHADEVTSERVEAP